MIPYKNFLSSQRFLIGLFCAFLFFVLLLGGGSREDINSLPYLRSGSAAVLAGSLLVLGPNDILKVKVPLLLLLAIALVAAAQLIPLPPDIWQKLPGRAAITEADIILGLEQWRPVTLSPSATFNALAALIVPLSGLLLFALVRDTDVVLASIVAMGIVSASLGVMQLFADPRSAIFFYETTNNGSAVGFFANRNHHAVFLACSVLISLYLARYSQLPTSFLPPWTFGGAAVFLGLAVMTNASRAGLICLLIVMLISVIASVADRFVQRPSKDKKQFGLRMPIGLATAASMIFGLFALAERSPAFARILQNEALEDLRAKLVPTLFDMISDFHPWGSGLGTFEHAYRMREPLSLAGPAYVNEAHNDWLQFMIEGGLASIILFVVAAVFVLYQVTQIVRKEPSAAGLQRLRCLGLGLMVVLGVASVVDYPLRVPSVMVLGIISLALFAQPALRGGNKGV